MAQFLIKNDGLFNPQDTLECGQIFRYKKLNTDCFSVVSLDKTAKIFLSDDGWVVECDDVEYFKNFFDLNTDYGQIVSQLSSTGEIMQKAVLAGKGIRILRQNLVEMIISFIISANNNIKRIQLIIEKMCMALGKPIANGEYAFPELKALASQTSEFFVSIGAGYRAEYLAQTCKNLYESFDFEALKNADTPTARKILLGLKGVGPKVADCILLFGLHRGDVFPVDTWIKKAYHDGFETGLKDDKISAFFVEKFKNLSGIAQQYLFYFYRTIDK